ncbi:MAG TPA: hypothetical protein VFW94_15915 [Candidatus Acidoferrales bacterium]|nr:hypothetical protein [Candidatus Acidoferrales bacterium]
MKEFVKLVLVNAAQPLNGFGGRKLRSLRTQIVSWVGCLDDNGYEKSRAG